MAAVVRCGREVGKAGWWGVGRSMEIRELGHVNEFLSTYYT